MRSSTRIKRVAYVGAVVAFLLLLTAISQSVESGGSNWFLGLKITSSRGMDSVGVISSNTGIWSSVLDGGAIIGTTVNASSTVTSITGSGNEGFSCVTTGCRINVGGGASDYIYSDGTSIHTASGFTSDGDSSAAGFMQAVTANGGFRSSGSTSNLLVGYPADGAAAIGTIIRAGTTLANASSKIASFQNNTTENLAIYFDGTLGLNTAASTPTYVQGKVFYDTGSKTLAYYNDNSSVTLNVGQEEWVRAFNNTGSTIANGAAVYVTGRDATNDIVTIALADADNATASEVLGIVTTTNCTTATVCYVTTFGRVNNFDTSALSAGAPFYLSTTAGALTSTVPASPAYQVRLGNTGRSDASVGWVLVQPGIVKSAEGTGATSGAWSTSFLGLVAEGANGQGAFVPTAVTGTTKFHNITCTCRVAGVGGSIGVIISLFENGSEKAACELTGGDSNACDDVAGTVLSCDVNAAPTAAAKYALQIKSSTDCATNPTDCACNTEVTQ